MISPDYEQIFERALATNRAPEEVAGPITSDVFQASPSHTVVSALCTRFWVEMPLGLFVYAFASTGIFCGR